MPAVAVTTALALAGVTLWPTVLSVLVTAIVMLIAEGALAALDAGVRGWRLVGEAAGAAPGPRRGPVPPCGGAARSAARGRGGPGRPRPGPCGGAGDSLRRPMCPGLRNAMIFV